MLNRTLALSLAAAVSVAAFATPVMAKELGGPWSKERFQVRVRAIDVIPDVNSSVNIGGEVDADYAVVPRSISATSLLRISPRS